MTDFLIADVSTDEPRVWNSEQFGTTLYYKVTLEDGTKAQIGRKPDSDVPAAGDRYEEGHLEAAKFDGGLPTLKGGKLLSGGGPTQKAIDPSPKANPAAPAQQHDERQWSIIRQHSQEMALRYLAQCDYQLQPDLVGWTGQANLLAIIDWFQKDATASASNAEPAQATENGKPQNTRAEELRNLVRVTGLVHEAGMKLTSWGVERLEELSEEQGIELEEWLSSTADQRAQAA